MDRATSPAARLMAPDAWDRCVGKFRLMSRRARRLHLAILRQQGKNELAAALEQIRDLERQICVIDRCIARRAGARS